MRYLIAFFIPPLGIFLCGKIGQAIVSLILCVVIFFLSFIGVGLFIVWVPTLHALIVVHGHLSDKRTDRIVQAIRDKGN